VLVGAGPVDMMKVHARLAREVGESHGVCAAPARTKPDRAIVAAATGRSVAALPRGSSSRRCASVAIVRRRSSVARGVRARTTHLTRRPALAPGRFRPGQCVLASRHRRLRRSARIASA
jgi:hypothetical protein